MARKPLTATCYLLKEGRENKKCTELTEDDYTPWEDVPPEEKERVRNIWAERLSRTMSAYYRQHPEEYAVFYKHAQEEAEGL